MHTLLLNFATKKTPRATKLLLNNSKYRDSHGVLTANKNELRSFSSTDSMSRKFRQGCWRAPVSISCATNRPVGHTAAGNLNMFLFQLRNVIGDLETSEREGKDPTEIFAQRPLSEALIGHLPGQEPQ